MKIGECNPAKPETTADGGVEASVHASSSDVAERLGGTAKPGWSPRKGRRLSTFLGASRVANVHEGPGMAELAVLNLSSGQEHQNQGRRSLPKAKEIAEDWYLKLTNDVVERTTV